MEASCFSFAEQLKEKLDGFTPETILILGSGLGSLAGNIDKPRIVKYAPLHEK